MFYVRRLQRYFALQTGSLIVHVIDEDNDDVVVSKNVDECCWETKNNAIDECLRFHSFTLTLHSMNSG